MLLEFLGAAHEVTGSCHFVQSAGKNMLIDCGMEQGPDLYVNQEIPLEMFSLYSAPFLDGGLVVRGTPFSVNDK